MDYLEGLKAVLLRHYREPQGSPVDGLAGPECAVRRNRTCGDRVTVRAVVEEGVLRRLEYAAEGCAVTMGLASVLSEDLPGRPVGEVGLLLEELLEAVMGGGAGNGSDGGELCERAGAAGAALVVRDLPSRRECAGIVLEAVLEALRVSAGRA